MKKLITAVFSALVVCAMATVAFAFEKGVDYIVIEETIPDYYVAYRDAYPASPSKGWPECTSGQILKGTVITAIDENGRHCWENKLGNNASAAFDGSDESLFDPYDAVKYSWAGVILDQAYELTEVRFKVRDGWKDRSYGAAIQASQDGEKWITLFMFKEEAKSDDYIILTPEPITDQAYLDAGCVDYSSCWFRTGSYKMYRFVNLVGKHGEVVELELYGNPAEPSEIPEGMLPLYSGECGDNLTWDLFETGELVIKGEGPMWDWDSWDTPWSATKKDIMEVTIQDGVTSIGAHAFDDCTNISDVDLGNTVTSIGSSAFIGCSKLKGITFPASVASIGESAFTYCEKLVTVTFSEGLTTIGDTAFSECSVLKSVTIPESVTSIGMWSFDSCPSLTKATVLSREVEFSFDVFYGASPRFAIYGYAGSTAEAYAAEYEHKFVDLELPPEPPFTGPEGSVNLAEVGKIISPSANDVSLVFDRQISTGLSLGGAGSSMWIGIQLDQPSILTLVRLATWDEDGDDITNAPHRIHKTVVEGSNDGETWEQIMYFGDPYYEFEDYMIAQEDEGENFWAEEAFDGDDSEDEDASEPVAYKYYRVWNDDDNDYWGEVEFWGTLVEEAAPEYILGDINGDTALDITDAVALFQYTMMPDIYPVTYAGSMDFTKDELVDIADAIYLFQHTMMPDIYPLA